MSLDREDFASEIMAEALWWRYSATKGAEEVTLSLAFQALFEHPVKDIKDLTGSYTTPIIGLKIKEILASPDSDVRFAASYDTRLGKRSFQHQLKVYEKSGKTYVWSNCIDVSERVALEREIVDAQGRLSVSQLFERQALLEEQNRFISDSYQKQSHFLAMLSHELRSPLLGISSLVERLRTKETDQEILTALKTIHITAEQSTFLVNDILTYSQTEYSEITLHPVLFSLKETLENVKQLTKSIAADKGLIVSLIYLGDSDTVKGDSVRLSQILINLIVNSIKFTQYGGVTIEISQQDSEHFSFKVTDSGEGIAEDQLDHIFEPFAQLESHGSAFNIGSGLGLLVVKKLVSLMGGEIQVQSTLSVGTSFTFDLVFDDISSQSEIDLQSSLGSKVAQGIIKHEAFEQHVNKGIRSKDGQVITSKILVADDSKINRMVLRGYLEELDYSVIEAKNGKQAWELFQANCFEYVFLDIQMPFMDGIQVSQKIQQHEVDGDKSTECLKGVFAVTAGGDESGFIPEGDALESVGFDCWFVKPITQNLILSVLKEDSERGLFKEGGPIKLAQASTQSEKRANEQEHWETLDDIPEQFHALVEPFMVEMELGIAELSELNEKEDWSTVAAKAHYLKGNCMLFQLSKMIELFRKIESISKSTQKSERKRSQIKLIGEKLTLVMKYLEKSSLISHNAS